MVISELCRRYKSRFATRFLKDQRGVASIEFLLIVPLLLTLMFGAVQFTTGFAALRKVTLVSRTMSDLISQAVKVCTTDIDNARAVGNAVMSPYPIVSSNPPTAGDNMWTTISQIKIASGTATVDWSRGSRARPLGSVVTVPQDLAVNGRYLIMSEVEYDFTPVVGFRMADHFKSITFPINRTSFTAPRQTNLVIYDTSAGCS